MIEKCNFKKIDRDGIKCKITGVYDSYLPYGGENKCAEENNCVIYQIYLNTLNTKT